MHSLIHVSAKYSLICCKLQTAFEILLHAGLVFVAWPHKSLNFPKLTQRLGIVYCVNRPCFMYHIKVLEAGSDAQVSFVCNRNRMILQNTESS